jgi:hypothetical protein
MFYISNNINLILLKISVFQVFSGGGYSERGMGTRKGGMRMYMVDVFCIHV